MYSLLCRHSKLGLSSAPHATADEYSPYNSETPLRETRGSLLIKEYFDKHYNSRLILLVVVLLGTSMVIGDGVLTPSMSGNISFLHYVYLQCEVIVWLRYTALWYGSVHRIYINDKFISYISMH